MATTTTTRADVPFLADARVWALMLDLSMGRRPDARAVINDWKFLCDQVRVREDARYLHHQGQPVALLCYERNAGECHRSLLVRELFADFEVMNLEPELVA